MAPKPITKALLRAKIKNQYIGVPRKQRTAYSKMNSKQLLTLATRIGAVNAGQWRVYKRKSSQSNITRMNAARGARPAARRPAARRRRPPITRRSVEIGIADMMHKNSQKRTTSSDAKWNSNRRYWDFIGRDTGITVRAMRTMAKQRGLSGYSKLNKADLGKLIARSETVRR